MLKRKISDTENNQNKGKHTKMSKQNEKKIMEKGKKLISHNKKREQLRKLAEENSISMKHRQKIWTRKPYVMTMKMTTPTIGLLLIQRRVWFAESLGAMNFGTGVLFARSGRILMQWKRLP